MASRFIPAAARALPPIARPRRRRRQSLADVPDFWCADAITASQLDPDYEGATWPELIDQTRLGAALSGCRHDEDEDDDPDTAIDDEPHDARNEDGI